MNTKCTKKTKAFVYSVSSVFRLKSLRLCAFAFSYLHAALHTETCRNSGQYRRQRLKNEFPSFLSHKSLTKPSQREGCFIVTSLQWPRL